MSKNTAATIGGCLWLLGLTLLGTVFFQIENPVLAGFLVMGVGLLLVGSWVSTAAKAMEDSEDEKPANP